MKPKKHIPSDISDIFTEVTHWIYTELLSVGLYAAAILIEEA